MLVIAHPPTYLPERRYIYDVLLGEFLGLDYVSEAHGGTEVQVRLLEDSGNRVLTLLDGLFGVPERDWLAPPSLPQEPLCWCEDLGALEPVQRVSRRLPILYGRPGSASGLYQETEGGASLGVDLFGGAFFLLTRYEEMVSPVRDRHGRFPASASLAWREGFLERPLVNEYVEVLWAALQRLWPRLQRKPRSYRVYLSHDVDQPLCAAGRKPALVLRSLAADVALRRDLGLAGRRLYAYGQARRGVLDADPANTFDLIMDLSERQGRQSAFYFIAQKDCSAQSADYALEAPWLRRLLRRIHERGHEIGLHGSYEAWRDPVRTSRECQKLRQIAAEEGVEQDAWGGRQHYLRWENPQTWENWAVAGLDYDSTLGYADWVGFRCGVCYEYPVFSLASRRALPLRERPLIVMDGTLADMGLCNRAACERILRLSAVCKAFAGEFALLWHNNNLISRQQQRWYRLMCESL